MHEPLLSPAFAQLDHEIVVLPGACLLAEMAFLFVAAGEYVFVAVFYLWLACFFERVGPGVLLGVENFALFVGEVV